MKRVVVVASTRHHRARLLKYYPRPPCAPSFVKSRIFRPLQTHFYLFQQIFFVLVCIHAGTPRVPPRVLASGLKPCGGKNGHNVISLESLYQSKDWCTTIHIKIIWIYMWIKSHCHMKGWAPRLALRTRLKVIQKWSILGEVFSCVVLTVCFRLVHSTNKERT